MAKMHIRKLLEGQYGIGTYVGLNSLRNGIGLYLHFAELLRKSTKNPTVFARSNVVRKAYDDLPEELKKLNAFEDASTFDNKIVPQLLKAALSPKYLIPEMQNSPFYIPIIESFVRLWSQDSIEWKYLDAQKKMQIFLHVLAHYKYVVKK
jgi:hypothetical protein